MHLSSHFLDSCIKRTFFLLVSVLCASCLFKLCCNIIANYKSPMLYLSEIQRDVTPNASATLSGNTYLSHEKFSSETQQKLLQSDFVGNPTPPSFNTHVNRTRLFYTRVPKCASTTTWTLFKRLSGKNHWNYPRDLSTSPGKLGNLMAKCHGCQNGQEHLNLLRTIVQYATNQPEPVLASGHVAYIDFRRFVESRHPVYISLIRDPLERLVSQYYYYQKSDLPQLNRNNTLRGMTYDQCVETNNSACTAPGVTGYFSLVPYFCGYDPICRYPNRLALSQAMSNIERDYAVVGLAEHYEQFLETLESVIPHFFDGALEVYHQYTVAQAHRLRNGDKPAVQERTRQKMMAVLGEEYQLYNFVKQRFFQQHESVRERSRDL